MRAVRGLLVGAALAALSSFGCSTSVLAPSVEEPLRVGNVADVSAESMGFRIGVTTFEDARKTLVSRGLTGVVGEEYASNTRRVGGPAIAVLGADYQRRMFVFVSGAYAQELMLPTHGIPPYGMTITLGGDHEARGALWVLYRDPLGREDIPPTLLWFDRSGARTPSEPLFSYRGRASLAGLAAQHGGMTRPLLVGQELDDGVMLVARDADGDLWDSGYLLRIESGHLAMKPQSMADAMRCSCVRRYAAGLTTSSQ